jgi:type 1 glutamine amidotransferase
MKTISKIIVLSALISLIVLETACKSDAKKSTSAVKLKALIMDGENNHGIWPKTTMMMKDYLEKSGLFEVDIQRKKYTWIGPHYNKKRLEVDTIIDLMTKYPLNNGFETIAANETKFDSLFNPNFEEYDLVVSNLGWKSSELPEQTKKNFEKYVANGGGLVIVHAANNAWGDWDEFNKMIALGGWGDRDSISGPYVYYNKEGEIVHDPTDGPCASHGPEHQYIVETREPEHPIMKGLPTAWLHADDELYDRLRGPGENMTILATAYSDIEKNSPSWNKALKGTDRHEPMIFTIDYGKGKVFHTPMGHMDYSMECVGFITTFLRGAEWAATGRVTQTVPDDFPSAAVSSSRKWLPEK